MAKKIDKVPEPAYRPDSGRLSWFLACTQRRLAVKVERALVDANLTGAQYAFLQVLAQGETTSAAGVSRAMHMSPQSALPLIVTLTGKRYIRRRSVRGAGHTYEILLTDAGVAAMERAASLMEQVEREVAALMGEGEFQVAVDALDRLLMALGSFV